MRLLLAALLLGAAAPAFADTRDVPVGSFDGIASSGPWNVRVRTGHAPSVHVDGPREALDRLQIEVVGHELRIGTKPGSWFSGWSWHSQKVMIDVTVPMLSSVALSGPGDLSVDRIHSGRLATKLSGPGNITIGAVDTQDIAIDLSGPGDITLAGRAGRASVRLSGPGEVRGKALTVGDVDVHLSGPGNIALTAFGAATGSLSGPGDIMLGGHPHCDISKSGPGSVHCG